MCCIGLVDDFLADSEQSFLENVSVSGSFHFENPPARLYCRVISGLGRHHRANSREDSGFGVPSSWVLNCLGGEEIAIFPWLSQ